VSSVVGLVLLFGVVIAGTGIIFWTAMDAKESVQSQSEVESAELTLQEASAKLSTLSFRGEGSSTTFDLSGKNPNDVRVTSDGRLRFRLNSNPTCSAEMELGSIVYSHDSGAEVAYQAGGVFKKTESGTTVVQSPSLRYERQQLDGKRLWTMRFPVTNVTGDIDHSEEVAAQASRNRNDEMSDALCLSGANTDEIEYVREINVTVVDSSYHEAWERYFVDEFGASNVAVDDGNVTAVVPLGSGVQAGQFPLGATNVLGGVYTGASAGELQLQTPNAVVNSYDSDDSWAGPTPEYGNSGDIYTRGDVRVTAQSYINGSVFAEGTVELTNACQVNGAPAPGQTRCVTQDVFFNNSTGGGLIPAAEDERDEAIGGIWDNGTYVPQLSPKNETIVGAVTNAREYNTNDTTFAVESEAINYTSGSATVDGGVYYVESLTVPSGSTLELDTSTGDVVVAVEESVDVDGTIEVTGDGQARVFVNGTSGDQLSLADGATVTVRDGGDETYRSDAFWVVCKAGCDATMGENAEFTGVLYGPGTDAESGTVDLGKHSQFWGAIVAGTVDFSKHSEFHFDTTLKNAGLDSDGDGVPDSVDNSSYADGDADGVPDAVDDCSYPGDGVNGCLSVEKDASANALVVNQPTAEITVVGSIVADNETRTREVGERTPLDVQFVIDDSGSMVFGERIGGWYNTSYPADNEVYDGETWRFYDYETDTYARRTEGETFDRSKWDYYYRYELGNDPYDERVDATQTFIGSLNRSVDEVGVYLFDDESSREHFIRSRGSDFDAANDSVETVESTGGTNIAKTIMEATDDYNPSTDDEKVIVLLTDGEHNVDNEGIPGEGEEEVRHAAAYAHDRNVTIYTIALGDDGSEDLLKDIALTPDNEHTNGSAYTTNDYSELTGIFEEIAGETTDREFNVVEYQDTTVELDVGGSSVTLSGNANTPTNDTRPSTVVDVASLQGANDTELEEYVGTLLSARATTQECGNVSEFATTTHNGEEYARVTCANTTGVLDDVTNASSSHEIYVDGESVPSDSSFDTPWFKNESFSDVISDYEDDAGMDLIDESAGEFDLGENNAIIVVRTNESSEDTDYVVLHFEARDTTIDYDVNGTSDSGTGFVGNAGTDNGTENGYVIDVGETTVEVGNESAPVAPVVTPYAGAGDGEVGGLDSDSAPAGASTGLQADDAIGPRADAAAPTPPRAG